MLDVGLRDFEKKASINWSCFGTGDNGRMREGYWKGKSRSISKRIVMLSDIVDEA